MTAIAARAGRGLARFLLALLVMTAAAIGAVLLIVVLVYLYLRIFG